MKFEFSTTVDNVNCHIRATKNAIIPDERVSERPHKHYYMEFHCILAGEETVFLPLENKEFHLTTGQILLLPRGIYHKVDTKNGTVERICFNFSAEPAGTEHSAILDLFMNIRDVAVFEDSDANLFIRQCLSLSKQMKDSFSDVRLGILLLNTALHLFSLHTRDRRQCIQNSSRAIRQQWVIEEYIERHFADDSGLEGLSRALFLSERQTRKLVRQFLGEDYKSIIIRRRMELADIYLHDSDKSLEEIAWQVGYRSYSGFQLCFKKHFGITPSERKLQLAEKNS